MSELNETINKAIQEQLPKKVGEELQKELAELARLRDDVPLLKATIESLKNDKNRIQNELAEERIKLREHDALDQRVKKIEEEEMRQSLERATYQLEAERDKTKFAKEVALGLVRNTTYRESNWQAGHTHYDNMGAPQTFVPSGSGGSDKTAE